MNRYQEADAAFKIDGYLLPKPIEDHEQAFLRARAECAKHMREQTEVIAAMSYERFESWRKQKFRA